MNSNNGGNTKRYGRIGYGVADNLEHYYRHCNTFTIEKLSPYYY